MKRRIFHLSIPVAELVAAKRFYVNVLGAAPGRETAEWVDVLLWGHQITLQCRPDEMLPLVRQGKRHFGVVLPWADWEEEARRIKSSGTPFLVEPTIFMKETDQEHAKFYLKDPSDNVIEVKAYKNVERTLGLTNEA